MNTTGTVTVRQNGNSAANVDVGHLMESVIIKGDLSKLTAQERSDYYMQVCRSVGLNPLTTPFAYITLNSKLTLYALRNCTDQLRTIYGVSVEDLVESEREGVFIVTAKVRNKEGRTDIAKGAVNIQGLKGENLANAMMKAETKAKRRATLSLCGLGFLDETEIADIPAEAKRAVEDTPVKRENPNVNRPEDFSDARARYDDYGDRIDWINTSEHRVERRPKAKSRDLFSTLSKSMRACETPDELVEWAFEHAEYVASLPADWEEIAQNAYQEFLDELRAKNPEAANHLGAG